MWIRKREITKLSENIRSVIDGKEVDLRDNREGPLSILKNDIDTLIHIKQEKMKAAQKERNLLADYLADISHQLKTPVTSMIIMAELLEQAPAEKQEEFARNIRMSLSRMEWLLSALLKMAKLESGVITFHKISIPTGELLESALQPLEIMMDVRNQQVRLLHDTQICCDRRWTIEALTNLLKNALEHSPEGGTILVDSGENPIYRWISIHDCGKGMSKEKQASLFRRFENSTKENGYGIGLPLSLSIIREQNGDIDVERGGKGKGATFTIKFYR